MIIRNERDRAGILRIGQLCGLTLQHMLSQVEPGMTTRQLDQIGAQFLQKHNAQSAPITAYDYPGWTCISVNDAVAHGVPDDTVIQAGDVVNIDVSAVLEGYWGDTGASMVVPPVKPEYERLMDWTRKALRAGIGAAVAGVPVFNIGRSVQQVAKQGGYRLIRELGGHGVGRGIHENPTVYNYFNRQERTRLVDGMVLTIEPFLTLGRGKIYTDDDDWTLRTIDGSISAQFEHTVIIDGETPILATQVEGSH